MSEDASPKDQGSQPAAGVEMEEAVKDQGNSLRNLRVTLLSLREWILLLGTLATVSATVIGLFGTGVIERAGPAEPFPPDITGLEGEAQLSIELVDPKMIGEYSMPLITRGRVVEGLGDRHLWLVLEPQDGDANNQGDQTTRA